MSSPSQWPLPPRGVRLLTPEFLREQLHKHPLTRDCYPTAMGYYPRASGHRMRRSEHDDNLLIYCLEGIGRLQTEGSRHLIRAGDLVMLPQGQAHSYATARTEPWTLYWVHFQGSAARNFIDYLGYQKQRPVRPVGLAPALASHFHSLLAASKTGYSSSAFINAANQLRHLITQFALEANLQQANQGSSLQLEAVQTYMREHIHHSLELDDLAAITRLSKYHFSNRYKRLTGYSPIKHFLHMKMEYACQRLDSSELSVKAIAAEVGYADPLYFSRLFRKTLGISPRDYRQSVRK